MNWAAMLVELIGGAEPTYPFSNDDDIRAKLTTTATTWPVVIKKHLDDFVVPQYNAIPDTKVSPKPGAAKVVWNTDAQIQKVVRDQSLIPKDGIPKTNGLPLAEPKGFRFDRKLHQLRPAPGHDIARGFVLVKDYLAGGVPKRAHTSLDVALQSIKDLAVFEGFCVRLASAIGAADRARVSLAEALALWRVEGDLLVPYSQKRFEAKAPTCDSIPDISLGDHTVRVRFSMKGGLWSFPFEDVFTELPGTEDAFKVFAFAHWTLIVAGLDFFWKQFEVDIHDRTKTVNGLATLLNAHHNARFGAGASTVDARKVDCNNVLDDLKCKLPIDIDERAFVAPTDPVKVISLSLGEALIFADLDTAAGKGPLISPTPKLKYLAYHTQDTRDASDLAKDKFTQILVSAAFAAAHCDDNNVVSLRLRNSLRAAPIELDKIAPELFDSASVYQRLKDANWWDGDDRELNLEELADFILIAPAKEWHYWKDHRGNMARYAKLLAYYKALLD